MMKRLTLITLVVLLLYAGLNGYGVPQRGNTAVTATGSDQVLARAFEARKGGFQVDGEGTVTRILPDDTNGGRHQRFIIRLASAQTLLVTHNIDLAPRIVSLKAGDRVLFNGEYEWNSQGGVIHWTHRAPDGRHIDGWIKHGGRTYQ